MFFQDINENTMRHGRALYGDIAAATCGDIISPRPN